MDFVNERLIEFNNYLKFRKVAIIGLNLSTIPLIDYLYELQAKVTVFDNRNIEEIPKEIMDKITKYTFEFSLGENNLSKLIGFDIIFRTSNFIPNIPEIEAEENRGAIITSEAELILEMAPCTVIGVTGNKGKSTTAKLIYEILKQGGYNSYLQENSKSSIFTQIKNIAPEDIIVIELNNNQLIDMEISPSIAVITNTLANNSNIDTLNDEYLEAEKNIFKNQNENGILVLNYDDKSSKEYAKEANGKVRFFSCKEKLDNGIILDGNVIKECEDRLRKHIVNVDRIELKREYNYENICAAICATKTLVDTECIIEAITKFKNI